MYLPRVDQVRAGDIFLSFNAESDDLRSAKVSRAITAATKGRFSHASMCSSPPTLVEAIGTGVTLLSLARCFAHDLTNVRVLRYPDQAIAARAASLVQLEVGRNYSVQRAVGSVFPLATLLRVEDHGIFCSALVAQAYTQAGSTLFQRTPVDRTTPATIDVLEGLDDITLDVFRPGLAPNNIETMSVLDGNGTPTLSAGQTAISQRYGNELFPLAKQIADDYPEISLTVAPTMYSVIDFVRQATDRQQGVRHDRRPDFDRRIFEIDQKLAYLIGKGEIKQLLEEVIRIDDEMISRLQAESIKSNPDIDFEALKGYLEAGLTEAADRAEALDSWKNWGVHRSAAVRAFMWADDLAFRNVTKRNEVVAIVIERMTGASRDSQ